MSKRGRLRKVDVSEGVSGPWRVERFTVDAKGAEMDASRAAISAFQGRPYTPVSVGTYTRLKHGHTIVMSDTEGEMEDHEEAVRRAEGAVLIAGLGLGMVLQAVLDKPDVDHVTVIEKSEDVMRLVGPHYMDRYPGRFELIQADIFTWKPPEAAWAWDVAWFDVWNTRNPDNLKEFTKLRRRFGRRCAWMGFWADMAIRRVARRYQAH